MKPSAPSKRTEALITDLFSTKVETVSAALEKIPEAGNPSLIIPLLKTYVAWPNEALIRDKVTYILYNLKTAGAIPELMKALNEPGLQGEKAYIISIFWNAGLIPTEMDVLVRHALHGDYLTAFEVITVIEQMDDVIDAEDARDAVFDIEEYLDEHPDAAHVEMLQQLRFILIDYSNL